MALDEDKAQPPPIYKHHGYKLVGENKRALLPVNDVVARLERAGLAKRDVVDSEDPVVAAPYSSLLYVLTSDDDHKTGDEDDAAVRS